VPLEKLLKSPELYANQMVALSRVYCIAHLCSLQPDGRVTLPVIESIYDLKFSPQNIGIVTKRAKSYDLEVDPKLASRLISARRLGQVAGPVATPVWGNNVAIVTMAVRSRPGSVATGWAPRIEKFEFLTNMGPQIVTIARKHRRKVVYKTVVMTADSEQAGEGKPDDWAQQERLLHIANQFKDLIENEARQISDARWAAFNQAVTTMINQGIRNAAQPPPMLVPRVRGYP
jgi:hypothetical protein